MKLAPLPITSCLFPISHSLLGKYRNPPRIVCAFGNYGYNIDRMRYEIILSPEAVEDLRGLKGNIRAAVRDAREKHLQHEPMKTSKSRIKRLRGLSRPQYRLRAENLRIFYDVTEKTVEILAIISKDEVERWLKKVGESNEDGGFK